MEKKSNSDNPMPELDKTASATPKPSKTTASADTKQSRAETQPDPDKPDSNVNSPAEDKPVQPTSAKAASSATQASADLKTAADKSTQAPSQPAPPSPSAPKSAPATESTQRTTAAATRVSKLAIIALVLAVIALAIISYGYTLIQKLHIQQSEQVNTINDQLNDSNAINRQLQQQNGQILGELNQVRSTAIAQQEHVDELQNRLAKSMQQVSKLGTDTRKDWLLAEVEYLLRLANQRVLMERNASGSLSLLKGADKILQETEDVSIYPVRKALAQDILALEAVPTLDIEGMFLKLVAIDSQIDHLRLLPTTDKHKLPEMLQQITSENMSQGWQDGISQSWADAVDKLGSLIIIRHRDDPVTPLLSPEQHFFLTQNLHLMLEQTQLALLQGKQQAFDTGLAKASTWISTYFEQSDPTTQALVQNLSALQGIEIAPQLPDISGSLKQLKTYLTELHNLEGAAR